MNDLTSGLAEARSHRSDADTPLEEIVLLGQPSRKRQLSAALR